MSGKLRFSNLIFAGMCLIGLAIWFYFSQTEDAMLTKETALESTSGNSLAAGQVIALQSKNTIAAEPLNATKASTSDAKPLQVSDKVRKNFDDEWCLANRELSPEDIELAESQIADWKEYQGVGRVEFGIIGEIDGFERPGNIFVASYQELPKEELKTLALSGDKWAMVAFIQNPYRDYELKHQIAKELLVRESSHHALKYLIKEAFMLAKRDYRQKGMPLEASEHYDDALVYALWGVEHYDSAGLNTYLALISDDHFDESLYARLLISNSSDKVTQRYNELSQWIRSEQQKLGIVLQSPPKAAINDFALQLALQKNMSPELVSWISEIKVSGNNRFTSTPCVSELMVSLSQD